MQHSTLCFNSNRKIWRSCWRSCWYGQQFRSSFNWLIKTSNCLNHYLLVAKLYTHGLLSVSLRPIFPYFSNHTHRTKINQCFSNRSKTGLGVVQGSILGPLIFKINFIDMFYECADPYDIENYADNRNSYGCASIMIQLLLTSRWALYVV